MKHKKLISLLLFCVCTLPSFAQWSIKGGLDYGTLTGSSATNYRFGFHIGAAYDVELSDLFYFHPSLLLSKHSFGFDRLWGTVEGEVDRYVFEAPVVISFRPYINNDTRFMVDAGLYGKCGLWGDREVTLLNYKISKSSTYDTFNRFDLGLHLGVGVNFRRIYTTLNYQYSFTAAEKDVSDFHYQNFRVSLGYKF